MGKLFFDGKPPQPNKKFKVGDRVKLIENKTALRFEGVRRHVGKIFTVEKKNFLDRGWRDEDLELVTEGAANG